MKQKLASNVPEVLSVVETPESPRPLRTLLIVVAAVIVVIVAAGLVYYFVSRGQPVQPVVYTADLPKSYDEMTPEQASRRYEADSGQQLANILTGNLNRRDFKNFKAAYSGAQALAVYRKYDRSVAAYAVAEAEAGPTDKTAQFYLNYASAALYNRQQSLAESQENKAVAAIRADTSLQSSDRDAQIDKIASKQRQRKLGN